MALRKINTGVPSKTHWCLDKNTLVNCLKHTGVLHKTHG